MSRINKLQVYYHEREEGTLALYKNRKRAKRTALQISETVNEMLSEYIREK